MHTRTILLAAAAVALAAPNAACAQGLRDRIDTTFAFERNGWLDASVSSGTIIVTGWTRPEARVVGRAEYGLIDATMSSSRIGIATRPDRNARNNRSRTGPVHLEISVPIGTRVMVSATSGNLRVRGTNAEVQANATSGAIEIVEAGDRVTVGTISGDIRLDRIRGRTRVNTTTGDLEIDSLTGELEIRSVSSDMRISRVQSSDVRIGTTSGDITYEGMIDPKGSYEVSTHSGDVRFEIPANSGAALSLQTYSGDIESAFPMTLQPGENIQRRRGQRMEFSIGGGGARVAITTFSGDIIIARGFARGGQEE